VQVVRPSQEQQQLQNDTSESNTSGAFEPGTVDFAADDEDDGHAAALPVVLAVAPRTLARLGPSATASVVTILDGRAAAAAAAAVVTAATAANKHSAGASTPDAARGRDQSNHSNNIVQGGYKHSGRPQSQRHGRGHVGPPSPQRSIGLMPVLPAGEAGALWLDLVHSSRFLFASVARQLCGVVAVHGAVVDISLRGAVVPFAFSVEPSMDPDDAAPAARRCGVRIGDPAVALELVAPIGAAQALASSFAPPSGLLAAGGVNELEARAWEVLDATGVARPQPQQGQEQQQQQQQGQQQEPDSKDPPPVSRRERLLARRRGRGRRPRDKRAELAAQIASGAEDPTQTAPPKNPLSLGDPDVAAAATADGLLLASIVARGARYVAVTGPAGCGCREVARRVCDLVAADAAAGPGPPSRVPVWVDPEDRAAFAWAEDGRLVAAVVRAAASGTSSHQQPAQQLLQIQPSSRRADGGGIEIVVVVALPDAAAAEGADADHDPDDPDHNDNDDDAGGDGDDHPRAGPDAAALAAGSRFIRDLDAALNRVGDTVAARVRIVIASAGAGGGLRALPRCVARGLIAEVPVAHPDLETRRAAVALEVPGLVDRAAALAAARTTGLSLDAVRAAAAVLAAELEIIAEDKISPGPIDEQECVLFGFFFFFWLWGCRFF
jgi:hypothetical protein